MHDMTHWYVWYDSFTCMTWPIHMRDMTHSYAWHDSFICVTWLIQTCDMTHSYVWHKSFMNAHSYVWHDSFICVPWLIGMRVVLLDCLFVPGPRLIHICDMTHDWLELDLCINGDSLHVTWAYTHVWQDSFKCVTWFLHVCDVTHSYEWHDSFTRIGDHHWSSFWFSNKQHYLSIDKGGAAPMAIPSRNRQGICQIGNRQGITLVPPKNASIALFSDEVRLACCIISWNFPAVQIINYRFHLRLNIKTLIEYFSEPIYNVIDSTIIFTLVQFLGSIRNIQAFWYLCCAFCV